jgi:DNA (cytosine-5)-methyltransferase 1
LNGTHLDDLDATSAAFDETSGLIMPPTPSRTFYEFFSGGGLVRVGLGRKWDCIGAIDIDALKVAAYRKNFGDRGLIHDDVRNLRAEDIPGTLDLVWSSFPCKDISVAGSRSGLDGPSSGAFWPFWSTIVQLVDNGRAPRVIALENVRNLLASNDGTDFTAVVGALVSAGYRVGAMMIDARLFLPHSRKRVFIIGVRADVPIPEDVSSIKPESQFHPPDLMCAFNAFPPLIKSHWVWWYVPIPNMMDVHLSDLLDVDTASTKWHSVNETADLVATMGVNDLAKLEHAKQLGGRAVGTIYVRSRNGVLGRQRRANVRMDGCASCLLTPSGSGSSQMILDVDGDQIRTRLMTAAEGARLMGLPSDYLLPRGYNAPFQIFGDGVVVPVIRHLAAHLLEPLVDAAVSWRPRTEDVSSIKSKTPRISTKPSKEPKPIKLKNRPGIKGRTLGTTVYLLPDESKRVRRLALDLDMSLHELLMRGLDRLLAENGQRPVERYQPTLKKKVLPDGTISNLPMDPMV